MSRKRCGGGEPSENGLIDPRLSPEQGGLACPGGLRPSEVEASPAALYKEGYLDGLEKAWKLAWAEKEMRTSLSYDKYAPPLTNETNRMRAYGASEVVDAIRAEIEKLEKEMAATGGVRDE